MSGWRGLLDTTREALLRWQVHGLLDADARRADGRRMTRGEVLALLWYLLALLASYTWLPHLASNTLRIAVALLPLPPVVLIVVLSVRRVLGLDELQRRIELVALAVVAVSTWLGLLTCWMLRHAGISSPPLSLGVMAMVLLYSVARRWAGRHYA